MVLKKTFHNLRQRPRHERQTVAAGIAISVMSVLFAGWLIAFIKKMNDTSVQIRNETPSAYSASSASSAQ